MFFQGMLPARLYKWAGSAYNKTAKVLCTFKKKEVFLMATKSITKNVVIRSKPLARNFVRALENAEGKSSKNVVVDKTVHEIKGDALREMFGKK